MKYVSLLAYLLFFVWNIDAAPKTLPSYVKICKRTDPELSKCWRNTLVTLIPYLRKGVPEFKTPPIEPFRIERLQLNQGNSSTIQFVADIKNCNLTGAGNIEITHTSVDLNEGIINLGMRFPHLELNGLYKAKGRVLLFQFDSVGDIEGTFDEVVANATYYLEIVKKNGKEHMHIKKDTMYLTIEKIYMYLHNLFRNNDEITKSVNDAINDNIDVLYEDFQPLLSKTIQTILVEYTNRVYDIFPYDVLIPKE